ncbi:hypothetical protein BCV70DRAFT_160695 [Testicularia cyperi]|uniref:Maintenance of telomere capping protein 1 n=1 Tax=Testicularia cyperi TaxID=1882483 RepID=A0A317XQG8_9BASI|nr:hypothetical protein BCV70DRAFT_160695 [Testicularia cyperi]
MSGRNRKDVDDLLADLDNLGTEQPTKSIRKSTESGRESSSGTVGRSGSKKAPEDAQSLLDDLDSLVQSRNTSSSRASQRKKDAAGTSSPSLSSSTTLNKPSSLNTASPSLESSTTTDASSTAATADSEAASSATASTGAAAGSGGWGSWGSSLFTQATKLAEQARQELEKRAPTQAEQARELGNKGWDLAKGVRGFVKEAGLEKWGEEVTKVGKRGWTDIVNAVAPPIAAHEIIEVTLSHDMIGYDGISDVTYQVLAKVMEQVDSSSSEQQLVVNKAQVDTSSSHPRRSSGGGSQGDAPERDLNAVEGFGPAFKMARANLDECIKRHEVAPPPVKSAQAAALPITTCPVFVRIQACLAPLPGFENTDSSDATKSLFFLILLQDPQHGLSHKTVSQAVPTSWLEVGFEENEWVEESLVDVISNALSVIGQDYVQGRMSGRTKSSKDGVVESDVRSDAASGETEAKA